MAFDTFDIWQRRGVKAIFRAVLVLSALDFRSRGRWLEPGHCHCVVPVIIMLGGNLAMD